MATSLSSDTGEPATRSAGIVLELGEEARFLPADVACSIVRDPVITPVPGSDLGVALLDGRVVPVFALGPQRGCAVVCEIPADPQPETFALVGVEVIEVGEYPSTLDGIILDGRTVPLLDLDHITRAMVPSQSRGGPPK